MLNYTKILDYIKQNLGFPWQFIELKDEEILEYCEKFTIKEFSQYFPDENTIGYSLKFEGNKVPGKANEFYLSDPDRREIYTVKNVYFSQGN